MFLNTSKTKDLTVDFRKEKRDTHEPIHINGMAVERVSSGPVWDHQHLQHGQKGSLAPLLLQNSEEEAPGECLPLRAS